MCMLLGKGFLRNHQGVSLPELMIAVAIISISTVAFIASFRYMSTSIQHSKGRTLATNLCQEQVEKLKNISYYTLLVTTSSYSDGRFNPPLSYDTGNYPAQPIIEGGISFARATRVDYVYQSGNTLTVAAPTVDDTALKQISVYTIWKEDGIWKYTEVHNLLANPASNPLNASFNGIVHNTGGQVIANALVQVIDNPNWYGTTDNSGYYHFNVSEGSYTLMCSSQPYYMKLSNGSQAATAGSATSVPFILAPISSGTVTGLIYKLDHLVVSEVAVSTDTGGSAEYVELYNPTTGPVSIGSGASRWVDLYIFDHSGNTRPTTGLQPVPLVYVSTYIAANGYYLIANSSQPIHVGGTSLSPDAYYSSSYLGTHLFDIADAGGTGIADTASPPNKIDALAWDRSAPAQCPSRPTEGNCIDFAPGAASGLQAGAVLMRESTPGFATPGYGRAYDSDDNKSNFIYVNPMTSGPNNTATGAQVPIVGTPAMTAGVGAVVNFNDPLSNSASCTDTKVYVGNCPAAGCDVCSFTNWVATGTWIMDASLGGFFSEIQNINVTANVSTSVPNGATLPTWAAVANTAVTLLGSNTTYALVAGIVVDANNQPLNHIEVADGNGRLTFTGSDGRYAFSASTGDITITANPSDSYTNRNYVSQMLTSIQLTATPGPPGPLLAGVLYDNTNFVLSLGGVLRGYFQTGSRTPLPGRVAIVRSHNSGTDMAQGVSDNTGTFYLANLSTGTYDLFPQLDPAEMAVPSSMTVVLSATGISAAISTFTVSNALSDITGQVLVGATPTPITTGVLVLATTATLAGTSASPPPTMQGSDAILCDPCYYAGSSNAIGVYDLQVRSWPTPYKLYGWYTTLSGNTVSYTRQGPYSVNVSTGGQVIPQNLTW
jgi:prepilin-type N-terminal cleavage/methylation domain-containing protein